MPLDYGLYHCLTDGQRRGYVAALLRVCAPTAQLHVFSFTESPLPGLPPAWLRVSRDNLRANLEPHWRILSFEEASCATRFTREFLEQQRATPPGGIPVDPDALDVDDSGRILLPMLHLHAQPNRPGRHWPLPERSAGTGAGCGPRRGGTAQLRCGGRGIQRRTARVYSVYVSPKARRSFRSS
jgi:hypothetical protein